MGKKIKTFLVVILIMIMLPLVITMAFQKDLLFQSKAEGESVYPDSASEAASETESSPFADVDIEGKVIAILAKEISVNSEKEAIKAQAVIARTNLIGARLTGEEEPEGLTTNQMMKLFGEDAFSSCYEKLAECAQETAGLVMVCNQKIIEAPYFAVSAGATRSASDAFGKEDVAYLQRVDSKADVASEDFLRVEVWETASFIEKCNAAYPEAKLTAEDIMSQVSVVSRDESEYVTELKLGEISVNGEEFRNALGLNSACFTIKEVEGKIRIVTKGLGHGVGLSQYGANVLAQEGKDYEEILKNYYSGIHITETE